jgi:hypothetical protein
VLVAGAGAHRGPGRGCVCGGDQRALEVTENITRERLTPDTVVMPCLQCRAAIRPDIYIYKV